MDENQTLPVLTQSYLQCWKIKVEFSHFYYFKEQVYVFSIIKDIFHCTLFTCFFLRHVVPRQACGMFSIHCKHFPTLTR